MSVNGIELAVGQLWRCRDGTVGTIAGHYSGEEYPWFIRGSEGVNFMCSDAGRQLRYAVDSPKDLIEFVRGSPSADANSLASELLTDLGWRFDGGTWVQDTPQAGDPIAVQVGGEHYKSLAIQPIEYAHANGLGFAEGSVIKYVTRWCNKNGIKDLEKVRHFIDLIIALEQRAEATK